MEKGQTSSHGVGKDLGVPVTVESVLGARVEAFLPLSVYLRVYFRVVSARAFVCGRPPLRVNPYGGRSPNATSREWGLRRETGQTQASALVEPTPGPRGRP